MDDRLTNAYFPHFSKSFDVNNRTNSRRLSYDDCSLETSEVSVDISSFVSSELDVSLPSSKFGRRLPSVSTGLSSLPCSDDDSSSGDPWSDSVSSSDESSDPSLLSREDDSCRAMRPDKSYKNSKPSRHSAIQRQRSTGNEEKPIDVTDLESTYSPAVEKMKKEQLDTEEVIQLDRVPSMSNIEVASNNKCISVVEPIDKEDARPAFEKKSLPEHVPAKSDRDDVSSIGFFPTQRLAKKTSSRSLRELGTRSSVAPPLPLYESPTREKLHMGSADNLRSKLEIFFYVLISLSLVALLVLIGLLVMK